jgi:hypothetical protein
MQLYAADLYLWSKGMLVGYRRNCERFFKQQLALPEKLELLFAPNGALYARTLSDELYSITPSGPN